MWSPVLKLQLIAPVCESSEYSVPSNDPAYRLPSVSKAGDDVT